MQITQIIKYKQMTLWYDMKVLGFENKKWAGLVSGKCVRWSPMVCLQNAKIINSKA